jgi:hypothetical protein
VEGEACVYAPIYSLGVRWVVALTSPLIRACWLPKFSTGRPWPSTTLCFKCFRRFQTYVSSVSSGCYKSRFGMLHMLQWE